MKSTLLCFIHIFLCVYSTAQTFNLKSSPEFKISRIQSIPNLIAVDESGIYTTSYRDKIIYMNYFTNQKIYTLTKYDLNFTETYSYEFKDESGKYRFEKFLHFKNRLYIISYIYKQKEKSFTIYGAEINKSTGKLVNDFTELLSVDADLKKSGFDIEANVAKDSSTIQVVVNIKDESTQQQISYCVIDEGLKLKYKGFLPPMERSDVYRIREIHIDDNSVYLYASLYKFHNEKRRRANIFSHFLIEKFDTRGKKIFTINTDSKERHVLSQKTVVLNNKEISVTGAYSKNQESNEIVGLFLEKYDLETGQIISTSKKDLDNGLIDQIRKRMILTSSGVKDEKKEEGLPNYLSIQNIIVNPQTSKLLVIGELLSRYVTTGPQFSIVTYTAGDLFIIEEVDQNGLSVTTLPKKQIQKYQFNGPIVEFAQSTEDINYELNNKNSLDFYISYTHFIYKGNLILFLNDHPGNTNIKAATEKINEAADIRASNFNVLTYDLTKHQFNRKNLKSNNEAPIPLINSGSLIRNEIIFLSRQPRFLGKLEFNFIRITVN
ncbi:MAG: hypothetical protein KGZ74_11650 [Chitinophagaceae bacterium]|nr:hypothetical protein [Chitinophagaceae bacterium]